MMGNAGEALRKWQAVGERIKRVRQGVGMTTATFAQEVGTSTLNIDLIENLSCCDEALLQDPETLAQEMRWDALLKHIGLRFDVSEEWLRTGGGNEPIPTIGKSSVSENDYEYVASIPLMISRSVLLEGVDMIVAIANGGRAGQAVFCAINACLYRMLTDLFLLYCHGMRATGQLDIATKTSKVMLDAMKQHPLYAEDAFGVDGEH